MSTTRQPQDIVGSASYPAKSTFQPRLQQPRTGPILLITSGSETIETFRQTVEELSKALALVDQGVPANRSVAVAPQPFDFFGALRAQLFQRTGVALRVV